MSKKGVSVEEEEQEDQRLLMDNKAQIESIMQLAKEMNDRERAEEMVKEARERVSGNGVKSDRVFHDHKGKRVAISRGASEHLGLGDALELLLRTRQHGADLHRTLEKAAERRVEILERILARGGAKG
jgi:hypothetical protein